MFKKILVFIVFFNIIYAKDVDITPNDVYGQVQLISYEIESLLKYYDINHDYNGIKQRVTVNTKLKPRNVWQKSYEIMIKINMLRQEHNLPIIAPVNMAPVLDLNPDLVYEQTQRIKTEFRIFTQRIGIKRKKIKRGVYRGKTPLDVYNGLSVLSASLDELNHGGVTPSYVFAENM
jgi:hypothetical protein